MPDLPVSPIPSRAQVAPAEVPGVNALLTLAAAVVFIAALFLAREVLIPVTLAVLLSFVLAPLVELLRSARLPRVPAVLVTVVVAIGIILALAGMIGVQIASLVDDFPRYQYTIEKKIETVQQATTERMSKLLSQLGQRLDHAAPADVPGQPPAAADGGNEPKPLPVEVHQPDPTPIELAQRYHRAGARPAGDHRHRLHRLDLHPAAARGSARPADPAVRLARPAPHHGRDGRRGTAAVAATS